MTTDFKDRAETVAQGAALIARAAPEAMKSFGALGAAATAAGALDTKTKELMALAIGIATHCDGCVAYHTRAALKSYQKAEGPTATGQLDSETRARLGMATSSTAVSPSASPATTSDTRGDANVTTPNTPASKTEKGVTSTKKQQP